MKISTKGRYALRLMLDLMDNSENGPVKIKDISKRQNLSEKYLEQIITPLNKAGYVKSVRGAQGGYYAAEGCETITAGDILRVMEGSLSPVNCVTRSGSACDREADCRTRPLWEKLSAAINETVDSVTLGDLQRGI